MWIGAQKIEICKIRKSIPKIVAYIGLLSQVRVHLADKSNTI
jgi:hypothetical protein